MKNWMSYFNYAWNVERKTTATIINSYYEHGFISDCITRCDNGQTLINSERK